MNSFARFLTGSILTLLVANQAFAAATTEPAASEASKSAATQASPAAAPAQGTAPATPSATAPAPATAAPATVAPATAAAAAPKQQAVKIGYVDMMRFAKDSKTGKAATASMKAKSDKLKAKLEAKQKQLEKQKAAIEAKLPTMTPTERAAKAKEFQKKVEEYQKLLRSSEEEMQQMQGRLAGDLDKVIRTTAESYAKSNGYSAILDQKAIIYISDALDATDVTAEIAAAVDAKKPTK